MILSHCETIKVLTATRHTFENFCLSEISFLQFFKSVPYVRIYFLHHIKFQNCIWGPIDSFKPHKHVLNTFNTLFRDCWFLVNIHNSGSHLQILLLSPNIYIMCLMCAYHVWFQNMVLHYKSYLRVENV